MHHRSPLSRKKPASQPSGLSKARSSSMIRIERLLDIVQAIFAPIGVHEFLVLGETLLFFRHGEFVPRFSLVVVVIAGEAWTEIG